MAKMGRIRVGNQTAASARRLMDPFELALSAGFDAFEWFPDKKQDGAGWLEEDLDQKTRRWVRKVAAERDIRLSVHARWQADPLDPAGRPVLSEAGRLARDLGASLLNVHLSSASTPRAFAEAILPLVDELAPAGVELAVENTVHTGPGRFNELFSTLRSLGSERSSRVGMCLDLGHANLCQETRNDYIAFVDALGDHVRIIHVHLHENYGDEDSHLPIFSGPAGADPSGVVAFFDRLEKRGFSGSVILEQWPDPPEVLEEARNRLFEIIGIKSPAGPSNPPAEKVSEPDGERRGVHEKGRPARRPSKAHEFAREIAEADASRASWRTKLLWVRDAITGRGLQITTDELAYLAVYLRFLGTGEVATAEEGGHHRPSHHARAAREIHESLAAVVTPKNVFVTRRIYPWLPSFEEPFTRSEPLTRIRDIAHRNDIPKELKKEIKHTLQNKLHRNAGPEDLITSAKLLQRVTADEASYPPSFVEELQKFHTELQEFFNAQSLERILRRLTERGRQTFDEAPLVDRFLSAKKKATTGERVLTALARLTELREALRSFLLSLEPTTGQAQTVKVADIKLEEFCFVLLSRLHNRLEKAPERDVWSSGLRGCFLAAENLALSETIDTKRSEQGEMWATLASEIDSWRRGFDPQDREDVLRVEATLARLERQAQCHSHRVVELFAPKAEELGTALGAAEPAVRVFAEADVRSHPVFQLSKIAELLRRRARESAGLSPWEVIVAGRARGTLEVVDHMSLARPAFSEPTLLLADTQEGDEGLPQNVTGLIVGQEVAHLSHLAVRAHQQGVVYVSCTDWSCLDRLKEKNGERLELDATTDEVTLRPPEGPTLHDPASQNRAERGRRTEKGRRTSPPESEAARLEAEIVSAEELAVTLDYDSPLLPLEEATRASGGGKVAGALRLQALTGRAGAEFETPLSAVIPFGVMARALSEKPEAERRYHQLASMLSEADPSDLSAPRLVSAAAELREIAKNLSVPQQTVDRARAMFGSDAQLMVRSSANCEDLKRYSSAGLYHSVANVSPAALPGAVRRVWASLWSPEAAVSRQKASIPHTEAHMAVLVQQLISPDLCWVIHTVHPVTQKRTELYMELAVGLGETLVSGAAAGSPYRLVYNKKSSRVETTTFASFDRAILPISGSMPKSSSTSTSGFISDSGLTSRPIDYSRVGLSTDRSYRVDLCRRLGKVGAHIEKNLERAQDVEGVVCEDRIYVVQSRAQQGLGAMEHGR